MLSQLSPLSLGSALFAVLSFLLTFLPGDCAVAGSEVPPQLYLIAGVDSQTGEILWESYAESEIPERYRALIPASFFDSRIRKRDHYTGWTNREDTPFRVEFEEPKSGGVRLILSDTEPLEKLAEVNLGEHRLVRSMNDRLFYLDTSGLFSCFRLSKPATETWKAEWQISLKPQEIGENENLSRSFSEMSFNDDDTFWIITKWGLSLYDFSGSQRRHLALGSRVDLSEGDPMFHSGDGVNLRPLPGGILIRDRNHFHLVELVSGEVLWSIRHGLHGYHAASFFDAEDGTLLLECIDTTPEVLRMVTFTPSEFSLRSFQPKKESFLAALELLRISGFRYTQNILERWLSQGPEKIPPKPVDAFLPDPHQEQRDFFETVPSEWLDEIQEVLEKDWKPIRSTEILDQTLVKGVTNPGSLEIPFDRKVALETSAERVWGYPLIVLGVPIDRKAPESVSPIWKDPAFVKRLQSIAKEEVVFGDASVAKAILQALE